MKLLNCENYNLVIEPLKKVEFNHLFAQAVVEQKIPGRIYVDSYTSPSSFYIVHPYGMSLLFGNCKNEEFNLQLTKYLRNSENQRNQVEWMQVYPANWSSRLSVLLEAQQTQCSKDKGILSKTDRSPIEEHTRVNFKFDSDKFGAFKAQNRSGQLEIFRTGEAEFNNMPGTVVPKFFWRDVTQFLNEGIGFTLRYNGELACTSFAAFIEKGQLELGIETAPQYRGKGFAGFTCIALIDYCLANKLEPLWSCRKENTGSFQLAQKLGFEPVRFHPFYKLDI